MCLNGLDDTETTAEDVDSDDESAVLEAPPTADVDINDESGGLSPVVLEARPVEVANIDETTTCEPEPLPNQVTIAAGQVIGATPKRNVRKQLDLMNETYSTLPEAKKLVITRRRNCAGLPLYSESNRGTCVQCKRETLWWCAGCHIHICVTSTTDEATAFPLLEVTLPAQEGCDRLVIKNVRNSCYMQYHVDAIVALPPIVENDSPPVR
jgi:hypothetical protein